MRAQVPTYLRIRRKTGMGTNTFTRRSFGGNGPIPAGTYVAFEDLLASQGSDFDYNDDAFVFSQPGNHDGCDADSGRASAVCFWDRAGRCAGFAAEAQETSHLTNLQ